MVVEKAEDDSLGQEVMETEGGLLFKPEVKFGLDV